MTAREQIERAFGEIPEGTTLKFDPVKLIALVYIVRLMRGSIPFTPRTVGKAILLTQTSIEFTFKVKP